MYEINKLLHGKRFVRVFTLVGFVSAGGYQKSHSFAALTRSISDTSPTRVKIPYARAFHQVISIHVYRNWSIQRWLQRSSPQPRAIIECVSA